MAGAPDGVSTFGACDMALGNMMGPDDLEAAYLVDGEAADTRILTGAQFDGFPT